MADDSDELGRRQFLQFAGVTSASVASIAFAGCLGDDEEALEDDEDDADDTEPVDDSADDTEPADDSADDDPADEAFEITMTQRQDPTTLDPHDHRETTTDNVLLHAYEGILWRDRDGDIIESLGTEWEQLEPNRHKITIREGVQFHDGTELSPSDCAFSIRRVVDGDVGGLESPQRDQLDGIVDAEVDEDDHAIIVHSADVNPMTFANLASHCPVVSEEWINERSGEEIAVDINGTGPYQLVDYEEGEFTLFERFDDYWGDTPEVTEVEIIAASEDSTRIGQLEAGETDVVSAVPPADAGRIEGDENLTIADEASTRILMLPMRYDVEPFTSQEFRQAMNYAINLDEMIDEILRGFGQATGQPTLEGHFGYNPDIDPYPYDPERAEELVDESGFAGAEIEIEYPAGRYLLNDELVQAAAGYIDDLDNVSCEAVSRDFGTLAGELLDGDIETMPPFFNIGWGNTTFDASQTLVPWLREGTSQYHYVDEEMNELLDAQGVEADPDERERIMQEINQKAHDEAVWVFLNQEFLVYGINNRIDWEPRQDEYFLAQGMRQA